MTMMPMLVRLRKMTNYDHDAVAEDDDGDADDGSIEQSCCSESCY